MNILLTGVTGNLGSVIAELLLLSGHTVLPVVRSREPLGAYANAFTAVVEADLESPHHISFAQGAIDGIVHCAGNVHFTKAEHTNEQMMRTIIAVAESLAVPIYHISTAFVWKPAASEQVFANAYERDKYAAEVLLRQSDLPYVIFRPSVLVGDTSTGLLRNWTGYYQLVRAVLAAAKEQPDQVISFPSLTGTSDMVPVDMAAATILKHFSKEYYGKTLFITNPEPPPAGWVLEETLNYFGIRDQFVLQPVSYEEYSTAPRTVVEKRLVALGVHFAPYWSLGYTFPESVCDKNHVTTTYLQRTLSAYTKSHAQTV